MHLVYVQVSDMSAQVCSIKLRFVCQLLVSKNSWSLRLFRDIVSIVLCELRIEVAPGYCKNKRKNKNKKSTKKVQLVLIVIHDIHSELVFLFKLFLCGGHFQVVRQIPRVILGCLVQLWKLLGVLKGNRLLL